MKTNFYHQVKKDNRDGKENKTNLQPRRTPSSQRRQGRRDNLTHQDGIMRGYFSTTRFKMNERD
jgi:hypothetical protein